MNTRQPEKAWRDAQADFPGAARACPAECGKDFVCVGGITLDEVYEAVRRYV